MRADELVERMRAGDEEAAQEVRQRLAARDVEVGRIVGERLAAGDTDLGRMLVVPDPDEESFDDELLRVAEATTSKPATTGPQLQRLLLRARRLGPCQVTRVHCIGAQRLMLLGRLSQARSLLDRAGSGRRACQACDLELVRNEAFLHLYEGRPDEGLQRSQRAIDGYGALGHPGHDLNGHGWASSMIARAEIRYQMGDRLGAAADFSTALEHFRPGSKVWRVTQYNLATTLAQCESAEKALAFPLLTPLRLSMRRGGETVDRAAFLWLDGQLVIAAKPRRKSEGFDRLEESLRIYRHPTIGMPREWLGVASDYARAKFPDRDAIAAFLERHIQPHKAFVTESQHLQRLAEIEDLCAGQRLAPASRLCAAIERLRGVAHAAIPCLLPPWPEELPR